MKKITIIALLLLFTISLSGCNNNTGEPTDPIIEKTAFEVIQDAMNNTTVASTMDGGLLPSNSGDVTITWSSNTTGTVSTSGLLIQSNQDLEITLTAVFTYENKVLTKLYTTTLLRDPNINYDLIDVTNAIAEFSFDKFTVTENITFVTSVNEVSVAWDSSDVTCVDNTGIVSRPGVEDEDCVATVTATFSKGTESDTTTFTFTVVSMATSVEFDGYYEGLTGMSGSVLQAALHTIINDGFVGVTYGEARYILDETDSDPNNPNNLILVYEQRSINDTWDSGNTWNREHVWPQSLLGEGADNGTVNIASDLQNLKPADPGENTSRSNKYFDNFTNVNAYEPPDNVKGDIARILFYMDVMYTHLELIDSYPSTYEMAMLTVLLEWNIEDPVDAFEMNRNEIIYSYQGNRNPFIDHPEYADLIWSN